MNKYTQCNNCHEVYKGIFLTQAKKIILKYNTFYRSCPDEVRKYVYGSLYCRATIKWFTNCIVCSNYYKNFTLVNVSTDSVKYIRKESLLMPTERTDYVRNRKPKSKRIRRKTSKRTA